MTAHHISRRTMLRASTATAAGAGAAVVIAACSSSSEPDAAGSAVAESTTAADDPTTASAPAPSVQSGGESSAAPDGKKVADLSAIPVGGSKSATLSGAPIVLTQTSAGTVVGFSAKCPHQGCTVAPAGKQFDCPCHGSQFDAASGKVLGGPAPRGLTPLTVSIADGAIYVKEG